MKKEKLDLQKSRTLANPSLSPSPTYNNILYLSHPLKVNVMCASPLSATRKSVIADFNGTSNPQLQREDLLSAGT